MEARVERSYGLYEMVHWSGSLDVRNAEPYALLQGFVPQIKPVFNPGIPADLPDGFVLPNCCTFAGMVGWCHFSLKLSQFVRNIVEVLDVGEALLVEVGLNPFVKVTDGFAFPLEDLDLVPVDFVCELVGFSVRSHDTGKGRSCWCGSVGWVLSVGRKCLLICRSGRVRIEVQRVR